MHYKLCHSPTTLCWLNFFLSWKVGQPKFARIGPKRRIWSKLFLFFGIKVTSIFQPPRSGKDVKQSLSIFYSFWLISKAVCWFKRSKEKPRWNIEDAWELSLFFSGSRCKIIFNKSFFIAFFLSLLLCTLFLIVNLNSRRFFLKERWLLGYFFACYNLVFLRINSKCKTVSRWNNPLWTHNWASTQMRFLVMFFVIHSHLPRPSSWFGDGSSHDSSSLYSGSTRDITYK